jgi:predicted nicotinamide N-methyase
VGDNSKHDACDVISGFAARRERIELATERVALFQVDDLARYVDRDALLSGADPAEPPYWAHCWSGARVLADAVPHGPRTMIEVGCGLGLPGVVAGRRGARVVFVDREPAPLAFVRETLRANATRACGLVVGDFTRLAWRTTFDVVLAAEILYDRTAFASIAAALGRLVGTAGVVLLADGHRIDTRAFYEEARAQGFACTSSDTTVREDGLPVTVSLVTMRRG